MNTLSLIRDLVTTRKKLNKQNKVMLWISTIQMRNKYSNYNKVAQTNLP